MLDTRPILKEIYRRIENYDALIEGCDGDEFIRLEALIAELSNLIKWIKETE